MSETITLPKPREKRDRRLKRQPPYHVILLNDDDHTVEYVVHMMQNLFGHPVERGLQIAREVHETGRCIVYTCTRELAELKQELGKGERSAGELLPVLFKRPLDEHQTFFAMGEAIAHLHYLYYAGEARRAAGADGIMRYAAR